MRKLIPIFLFQFSLSFTVLAQSEAGAIFLLIHPSPTMNGLGGIGVCLPSDDAFAGYYNPANGINPFKGVSLSSSKMKTQWLRSLLFDMFFEYDVKNVGIIPRRYPFQLVISWHKTFLDLGEQTRTDEQGNDLGSFNSYMKADALTFGLKYIRMMKPIPFELSIGFTKKLVTQDFSSWGAGAGILQAKLTDKMFDYGLLLSTPFHFQKLKTLNEVLNISIIPAFGYSVSNIGDEISFFDSDQADPTPRILRIGLSLTTNISFKSEWKIVEWKGGRAASDVLIKSRKNSDDPIKYQTGLGDIDFVENILQRKIKSGIEIHRGDEITVLDFYSIRTGRKIDRRGRIHLYTMGYGYKLSGILNFLYYLTDNPTLRILYRYIDLQYNYSEWSEYPGHPLHKTDFDSYTFTINNIDQLIIELLE